MKILLIHTYYKQRGGEDIVYENEARLLAEKGFSVKRIEFSNKRFSGLKFILCLFNPFSFFKVLSAIKEFKPDIIHIHNWFFGASPSVFMAARLKNIPVVHTLHNFRILCPSAVLFYGNDLYLDSVTQRFPFDAIKKKLYRNSFVATFWLVLITRFHFFIRTWASVRKFICLTENSRLLLIESYLKPDAASLVVKPNYFDSNTDHEGDNQLSEKRSNNFLFIGRLTIEKGVQLLLQAFVINKLPLTIIGEGPLKPEVISASNGYPNITYAGSLQPNEVLTFIKNSSALIMPSICYEPFGLVIIESFYCSTPVIATNVGAPADLVQNGITGLHFKSASYISLNQELFEWNSLAEENKMKYYNSSRKAYLENFTREINFEYINNIYKMAVRN